MDAETLASVLRSGGLQALDVGELGLISLYDDREFSNYDYDILPGPERSLIRRVLIAKGWQAKGSRYFYKDSLVCGFAKPSHTLGCNPADKVIESIKEFDYLFVTPTQALLTLLALGHWNISAVLRIVFYQGANLEKLFQWAKQDRLELPSFAIKLGQVQEQGQLKRKGQAHESFNELLEKAK